MTDEQLREAAATAQNLRQLLDAVGLVPCGGNYEVVRRRLRGQGLLSARFAPRAPAPCLPPVTTEALVAAVAASRTWADVLRRLGEEPDVCLYPALQRAVTAAGLCTAHFRGRGWSRGSRRPRVPLDEVLVAGRRTSSLVLRRRLVEAGLRDERCSRCALDTWQGVPVPLELDHVNGDRDDNRLENLRLLCPNCHALTDTWRGRNVPRRAARS